METPFSVQQQQQPAMISHRKKSATLHTHGACCWDRAVNSFCRQLARVLLAAAPGHPS
jgi:hypothetical protein